MKTIPEEVYRNLSSQLILELQGRNYYNGRLDIRDKDGVAIYSLRVTIINNGEIIPVWYSFTSFDGQYDNDFTWTKFKEYLG